MAWTIEATVPDPKKIFRLRYTMYFCRYTAMASLWQKYFIVSGTATRVCSQMWKKESMAVREVKTMAV